MPALAQDDELEYEEEFDYGINWNTNGGLIGGGMFKYVRRLSDNRFHYFGLEIANVKHGKELSLSGSQSSTYIPNKLNYLLPVRPQYGREFLLFRKAPENGVQMNAIIAAGPTIGVIKPYYISWQDPSKPADPPVDVQYDPAIHNPLNIAGAGSPFDGLDKLKAVFGMHAKASLSFEFGSLNGSVVGAELGFLGEVFTDKIPIMYEAPNKSAYGSAFFTLYYGTKK